VYFEQGAERSGSMEYGEFFGYIRNVKLSSRALLLAGRWPDMCECHITICGLK